jgi:NAD(P)-dependent dehydrogenase (short-subunit alcohol dehydrogenase family)
MDRAFRPGLDMFSLEGKRALITGGSRGIGFAIADGLAHAGAQVSLVARDIAQLRGAAGRIGGSTRVCVSDVSAPQAPTAIVEDVEAAMGGSIDIVVHCAGVQHREPARDFDPREWDRILAVNLTAPFLLSQFVGRRQLEAGRSGSHIFIGSVSTYLTMPNIVAYTVSKSGIHGLIRNLSREWSAHGIRVNGIGPGYIETRLTAGVLDDPETTRRMLDRIPMNRFGRLDEVVGAAIYLASNAASYVTGQMLMVDGGWTSS